MFTVKLGNGLLLVVEDQGSEDDVGVCQQVVKLQGYFGYFGVVCFLLASDLASKTKTGQTIQLYRGLLNATDSI